MNDYPTHVLMPQGTFPVRKYMGLHWVVIESAPCPWCAIFVGPHGHSLAEVDAGLGVGSVVVSLDQMKSAT